MAQQTGSGLLNHSDSAGHPLVSFPSVISPRQSGCLLCLTSWSINWSDYQGEKNQFVQVLYRAFLDRNQNSNPQKCAERLLPQFFKRRKTLQTYMEFSVHSVFWNSVGGKKAFLQFSHHTEIFKRSIFSFKKYLCYYIAPLQLEPSKPKSQLHGSRTRNTPLLHSNKAKNSSKTNICHSGVWKTNKHSSKASFYCQGTFYKGTGCVTAASQ